jgi:hypothetical protein
VAYTGQTYVQNFDSLPDPGTVSVNTGTATTTIIPAYGPNAVTYNVRNPFDFAEPIAFGGLGLSNTMAGWYSSDLGNEQIQATTGDNTTGLIVSFGCTNAVNTVNPLYPTNNRALGMLASPATSAGGASGNAADAIFALRLRNLSRQTLTSFNLSYVSELWRNTSTAQLMTNWYYVDTYGTNTTPMNNWTGGAYQPDVSEDLGHGLWHQRAHRDHQHVVRQCAACRQLAGRRHTLDCLGGTDCVEQGTGHRH